jgi:hypothetical protein
MGTIGPLEQQKVQKKESKRPFFSQLVNHQPSIFL